MYSPTIVLSCALLAAAAPASAQGTRGGGLFGATRSESGRGSSFNVTFSASEAYDSEVPAEFRQRLPQSGPQSGGFSTMLMTALQYMNVSRRGQIVANGQTAFRYYQRLAEVSSVSHSAAVGGRLNLSRNAQFTLNQTAAYSPSYLYQLFPGVAPPDVGDAVVAAPDFRVHETESYAYGTSASLGVGSARLNRFTISADYRHTDYRRRLTDRADLTTYSGQARYSRGLGRSGSVSAGYEYRTGEFGFGHAVEHRLNIGGEYSKALASSRRATFSFTVSPSLLDIPQATLNAPVTGRVHRLQGDGRVQYQLGRTWQVGASYRRSVEYVPLLVEPLFADSARLGLAGLITRRLDLTASAGYANGESALTRSASRIDTYTGSARARFALLRSLALYTEYLYYFYNLRGQAALAPGLPSTLEQHGVRAGLMIWMPVF